MGEIYVKLKRRNIILMQFNAFYRLMWQSKRRKSVSGRKTFVHAFIRHAWSMEDLGFVFVNYGSAHLWNEHRYRVVCHPKIKCQ